MRFVGSIEYGKYSFLLSQCSLIAALGYGWLNQAQLRYFSSDSFKKKYKIYQIKFLSYSGIFCLIFLSLLSFYQPISINLFVISIIAIIAMGSFNYLKTFYQSKLLPGKIIILTSIQSSLSLVIPLVLLFFIGFNEISLLFGVALSFLSAIVIMIKVDKKIIIFERAKEKTNIKLIKKWFVYGSPLSFWFAIGLALAYLDRFFINYYLSSEELGIYASLQELLTRSFSLTLFPLTMALHPRIMNLWNKSKRQDANRLIFQALTAMFFIGSIMLFIIWNYNDFIFYILQKVIPDLNNHSQNLILPLFSAGFLWQLSLLTHKMLELKEQTILMTIAILPSLIINIIGNSYFLPTMGGVATAYTALFSALTYCIITSLHFIYSMNKINLS